MEPILFYKTRGPYGSFSNFSRDEVTIFGRTWATSEAAFQAMKFHPHRPDVVQRVFDAVGPKAAAELGRDRSLPIHPQWETDAEKAIDVDSIWNHTTVRVFSHTVDDGRGQDVVVRKYKDAVMFVVVLAKFLQDPEIAQVLMNTGSNPLIEDTRESGDGYWGWGRDMKGVNRLGKILMGVRGVLLVSNAFALEVLNNALQDLNLATETSS